MLYLIPTYEGNDINPETISSIKSQTVKCQVKEVCGGKRDLQDRAGEIKSRNLCLGYGNKNADIWVMGDDDARHLYRENLSEMLEMMASHDVVVLRKRGTPARVRHHYNMACMMIRSSAATGIQLEGNKHDLCLCFEFAKKILARGGKIIQLDELERIT